MKLEVDGEGDFGFDGLAVELGGAEGPLGNRRQRGGRKSRIAGDYVEAVSFAVFPDQHVNPHRAGYAQLPR